MDLRGVIDPPCFSSQCGHSEQHSLSSAFHHYCSFHWPACEGCQGPASVANSSGHKLVQPSRYELKGPSAVSVSPEMLCLLPVPDSFQVRSISQLCLVQKAFVCLRKLLVSVLPRPPGY